jgi:hypothetical protein
VFKRKLKALVLAKSQFVVHRAAKQAYDQEKKFSYQFDESKVPIEVIEFGQSLEPICVIKIDDNYHYFSNWRYLNISKVQQIKTIDVFIYDEIPDGVIAKLALHYLLASQLKGHDKQTNLADFFDTLELMEKSDKQKLFNLGTKSSLQLTTILSNESISAVRNQSKD